MSSSAKKSKSTVRAIKVWFTEDHICLKLADGREIKTPLDFYPRLRNATPDERNNVELNNTGTGIHWPQLDEHLTVEGIILGKHSSF
jgi:hypothetical protein